jgi:asparagine synthase (glutamine-hydrolysing)
MCGISGVIDFRNKINEEALRTINDTLTHRGPDNGGTYIDKSGHIGLAQRRLNIIDLSHAADQPMSNEHKDTWLVFNGEIYNYQELKKELLASGHEFKSNSDSEVILHGYEEWGTDILNKLRGMFAFAIWDENKSELFAARDHTGIKPFIYYYDGQKFIFASELKSILADKTINTEIDETAVYDFFTYNYIPTPKTILKHAFKLAPGHYLTIKNKKITTIEYWDVDFARTIDISETEAIEKLRCKLDECIELNLVSDLPVGVFLSGGLDSGTVATLASKYYNGKLSSFSLGYENYAGDETAFASILAAKLGLDHHKIVLKNSDVQTSVAKVTGLYDEPYSDSSAIPTYFLCKKTKEKVTVVLSGDGGDEIFGGYNWYAETLDYLKTERYLSKIPFVKGAFSIIDSVYPFVKGKGKIRSLSLGFWDFYCFKLGGIPREDKSKVLSPAFLKKFKDYDDYWYFKKYWKTDLDPFTRMQYLDFKTYMHDDVLTKIDRASMAFSLEVRVPLLDHTLIELVASFPKEVRNKSNEKKYLFKKAIAQLLPQEIFNKKKTGFNIPLDQFIPGENYLQSDVPGLKNVLHPDVYKKKLVSNDIWKIINLQDAIKLIDGA